MEDTIRAGVVGVGSLGQHHARLYAALPGAKLISVADISDKAGVIAEKYGAKFYKNYRDMVDSVDAVSIAVPTTLHYEVAKFFLQRGKHVLLEKPMTATAKEAKKLLKIYKKRSGPQVFQVGHIERFNVAVKKMQELKKTPVLIEANRLGPFTARSIDISVMLDLMIHDIDIILQLVDSDVKSIAAKGVPLLSSSTDMASARIEFKNGCVANVTASRVSPKKIRKIRVFEKNIYMSIDYMRQSIKIYKIKENLPKNRQMSWNDMMEIESFPMYKEEPLAKELGSFLNAIKNNEPAEVTPFQAYRALKIVLEIEDQIKKNTKNKKG